MPPASRPQWQQATALITLGAGSIATGLSIVPQAQADLTSPASLPPVTLLALEHAAAHAPGKDAMLRAAIVHMARHFLRLAQTRSPAEMEAMIWQYASTDGADHGPSCAAFASLTLELGSHIAGLDSWVTGGTSYPWPVHSWVDGRVDPNPASSGVVSVLQDAENHGRWHPVGDGYTPQPGDWVLFDGHVEVVTKDQGGVLHTIGGDSLPNMSVNAHEYAGPLQAQGVAGFVDNGVGMSKAAARGNSGGRHGERAAVAARNRKARAGRMAPAAPWPPGDPAPVAQAAADPVSSVGPAPKASKQAEGAPRAIPAPPTLPRSRHVRVSQALPAHGARPAARQPSSGSAEPRTAPAPPKPQTGRRPAGNAAPRTSPSARGASQRKQGSGRGHTVAADVPATAFRRTRPHWAPPGQAAIPGLLKRAHHPSESRRLPPYHRHDVPTSGTPLPGTAAQQAFINEVARGAVQTQRDYGVPASVTIAQAIDESAWGQSILATNDHNLFGIKGTGPAGTDVQPTQEVINGQLVNLSASFQMYRSIAQSIDAHARLLARSGDYAGAMAQRKDPNAFAAALTGIYATDPQYGSKLIQLMQQYDLYRFDHPAAGGVASGTAHATHPAHQPGAKRGGGGPRPSRSSSPGPDRGQGRGNARRPGPRDPGPVGNPVPVQPAPPANPVPGQPGSVGNPVPVQPAPVAGPPSRAHNQAPANGPHAARGAARPTRTPPGQAADRPPAANHDGAEHPAATLYPGRSARPGPLAHPARPTDLAGTSGSATGPNPGATEGPKRAQQPAPDAGQSRRPGGSQDAARNGEKTRRTTPGSGTVPRRPNISGDAAIPGVPHVAPPHGGRGHIRLPGYRLRPAHPAGQMARPAVRSQINGQSASGTGIAPKAGAQVAAPAAAPPPRLGAHASAIGHIAGAAPAASADDRAGGAVIPGLQHESLGAGTAAGLSTGGTAAANDGVRPPARPDAISIPGAQPGIAPGSTAKTPTAPTNPMTVPRRVSSESAPVPGPVTTAPVHSAAAGSRPGAPGRAAGATGRAEARGGGLPDGSQALAGPGPVAATPWKATRARGHTAAAPGHAAAITSRPRAAPNRPAAAASHAATQHRSTNAPGGPAPAPARPSPPAGPRRAPANSSPSPARSAAAAASPSAAAATAAEAGAVAIPGLAPATPTSAAGPAGPTTYSAAGPVATTSPAGGSASAAGGSPTSAPATTGGAALTVYHAHMPPAVREAFVTSAKTPLVRAELRYRDVASHTGIRWEILAACDWMQCKARQGYSPVYGEKLGTLNPDDTCYRTKSAALEQCASDLVQLAHSVYQLDIATGQELTIRDLANVFAAFRWGGLLRQHCTSAMDFPYSVAGLTADHTRMRWPNIDDPNAPDKPGGRFRQPFGAVPVVLGLGYQALM